MSKVLSSLIAVLLVTSVSLADVSQTENYLACLGNGVTLVQCETVAGSTNNLIIDNKQNALTGCYTVAGEFQMGVFRQAASANGICSTIGVLQEIGSGGLQVQMIGDGVEGKLQQENLMLTAGQAVTKTNGQGTGTANQFAALAEGQNGANCAGTVNQSSAVVACQDAFVTGIPTAQGMAGATTQVSTSQAQLIN
jgi:hypothetical protein